MSRGAPILLHSSDSSALKQVYPEIYRETPVMLSSAR